MTVSCLIDTRRKKYLPWTTSHHPVHQLEWITSVAASKCSPRSSPSLTNWSVTSCLPALRRLQLSEAIARMRTRCKGSSKHFRHSTWEPSPTVSSNRLSMCQARRLAKEGRVYYSAMTMCSRVRCSLLSFRKITTWRRRLRMRAMAWSSWEAQKTRAVKMRRNTQPSEWTQKKNPQLCRSKSRVDKLELMQICQWIWWTMANRTTKTTTMSRWLRIIMERGMTRTLRRKLRSWARTTPEAPWLLSMLMFHLKKASSFQLARTAKIWMMIEEA